MSTSSPALRLVRSPPSLVLGEARERTLEALYADYAPYVGSIASRLLGRAGDTDDVVQDVFTIAIKGLRRRDDDREIKGWLARVTVRRCIRQLRLRRLWAFVDGGADSGYEHLAEPSAGPEERHLVREVYGALDRIPAVDRVAWTLRHVEGENLEAIAVLCDCSLATAKRRIASAHDAIQRSLEKRAGGAR